MVPGAKRLMLCDIRVDRGVTSAEDPTSELTGCGPELGCGAEVSAIVANSELAIACPQEEQIPLVSDRGAKHLEQRIFIPYQVRTILQQNEPHSELNLDFVGEAARAPKPDFRDVAK
jgi:hypothetical protein